MRDTWTSLKEICDINMGQSPDSNSYNQEADGLPFYQGNADFGELYPTTRMWCNNPTKIVEQDVLLISVRAPIGALNFSKEKCCIGRGLAGLTGKGETNLKYIYYCLKYKNAELNNKGTGSTFKAINKGALGETKIKVLSLPEQDECVAVLDKVNSIINKRKEQINQFDYLIKSRFVDMFGDPQTNPKGWIKAQMGEYLTTLTDFSANGSYEKLDSNVTMYDDPNFALMVRTTDLEKQDFENGVKYIDENAYELLEKSKVFGNEIIMNKIGSAGKIYLMPCLNRPVSLGRNAFLFRYSKDINPEFMYNLLSTDYGTREIMQHVRGAVTKTITKDATRSVKIIVPPIDLQNQFAAFVQQVDKLKVGMQKSLNETQMLFDSLMQDYFE